MIERSDFAQGRIEAFDPTVGEPEPDRRQRSSGDANQDQRQRSDRRRAPRQRVLLTGLIVHDDFSGCFPCTIRSLSAGGARTSVPDDWQAPAKFWLIKATAGIAHEATLAWRQNGQAGLRLGPGFDLRDPGTPTAVYLAQVLATAKV